MYELRQPSNPFGIVNETLDDTIIMNENIQEADYHIHTKKLVPKYLHTSQFTRRCDHSDSKRRSVKELVKNRTTEKALNSQNYCEDSHLSDKTKKVGQSHP